MSHDATMSKLKEIMRRSCPDQIAWDTVTADTPLTSLGFDSLAILDLIYDAQQEFNIQFDAEELIGMKSVRDIVTFVERKQSA